MVTYKGNSIGLTADFLADDLQVRRDWDSISKIGLKKKKKNCQPENLYPARKSFRNKGDIKSFLEKQSLRESVTTRLALQK